VFEWQVPADVYKKRTVIVGNIDSYSLFPLTQQFNSAATLETSVQGIFIELTFEVISRPLLMNDLHIS
jgi:hypothetical protein